ncbi:MAG: PilZ domain-containing protein [Pseudomonadota bacterium]
MSKFTERRKFPRVQAFFRVSLSLSDDTEKAIAFAQDISRGGIYFQTEKLLGPNDIVEVSFSLPGASTQYQVKGQVVRLVTMDDPNDHDKNKYGAGIRFIEISDDVLEAIKTLVENSATILD